MLPSINKNYQKFNPFAIDDSSSYVNASTFQKIEEFSKPRRRHKKSRNKKANSSFGFRSKKVSLEDLMDEKVRKQKKMNKESHEKRREKPKKDRFSYSELLKKKVKNPEIKGLSYLSGSNIEEINFIQNIQKVFQYSKSGDGEPGNFIDVLLNCRKKGKNSKEILHFEQSMIPKEFHIYTKNPIGLELYKEEFSNKKKSFEKKVFPSYNPNKRIEVYLLARTIDSMIEDLKIKEIEKKKNKKFVAKDKSGRTQTSKINQELFPEILSKTFYINSIGLSEIARQIGSQSRERAVLINKMNDYFRKYFELSKELLIQERKKAENFRVIIADYENLISEIEVEKRKTRKEMESLLKEKTKLYVEREELKRKNKESNKYEHLMKLIDNQNLKDQIRSLLGKQLKKQMIVENAIKEEYEDQYKSVYEDPFFESKSKFREKQFLPFANAESSVEAEEKEAKEIKKIRMNQKNTKKNYRSLLEKQKFETEMKLIGNTCAKTLNYVKELSKITKINLGTSQDSKASPISYLYEINAKLRHICGVLGKQHKIKVELLSGDSSIGVFFDYGQPKKDITKDKLIFKLKNENAKLKEKIKNLKK